MRQLINDETDDWTKLSPLAVLETNDETDDA